ncbi:MAG: hypothetical protein JW908_15870 [Anaerolineales bacterium]|nr:hypothetical protein [Anaerolineales bacterium]
MGNHAYFFLKNETCLISDTRSCHINSWGKLWRVAIVITLFWVITACQPAQKTITSPSPVKTTQPPPTVSAPTQTFAATSTTTHTPQPTIDMEATRAVVKAAETASASATARAVAPIHAELPVYNASPSFGYVGAIYEPITLTVDGYHASDSTNKDGDLSVRNFLLAADITWDSEYGIAGCGFTFRSDGDKDAPNEYRVILSRISGGRIYFYALANGKVANFRNFYAIPYDPSFKWGSGTTNRLTLGVKDNNIYIFSNQIWVGALDITDPPPQEPVLPEKPIKPIPPGSELTGKDLKEAQHAYKLEMEEYREVYENYKEEVSKIYADYDAIISAYSSNDSVYDEGTVGMLAYSTAGNVNCQFSNAWLWVLDQP